MPEAESPAPSQVNTGSTPPTDYAALGKAFSATYAGGGADIDLAASPAAPSTETPAPDDSTLETSEKKPEPKAEEKKPEDAAPKADTGFDKALGKVQQQLSSIESRFEALVGKIEKAGGASPEQLAALQKLQSEHAKAKSKIETIAAKSPDAIDTSDVQTLAGEISASDKEMRSTIEELRAARDADRKEFAELRAEMTWQIQETRFPGINVRDIWDKSKLDAAKEVESEIEGLELTPETATKLAFKRANALYQKRVEEASKSKSAKSAPETRSNRPTAAAPVTEPIAPAGSGRVSSDLRSATPEQITSPHQSPSKAEYAALGEAINRRLMG
jgi:hypothetical protein